MAELNIFHYIPTNSFLHRLDSRVKLFSMILFSMIISFSATPIDLLILSGILLVSFFASKLPIKVFIMEIRQFIYFIFIIILIQSYSIPGVLILDSPIPMPTIAGLCSGLFFGWKIILVIINCLIVTGTTPLSAFRDAIEWFLRPIPFVQEARVGTMFSLTFSLLPLIFDQTAELTDAQRSRCIDSSRHPLRRIKTLAAPLILRTMLRADEIAMAMESRCYSDERTKPSFKTKPQDWMVVFFVLGILILFLIHRY